MNLCLHCRAPKDQHLPHFPVDPKTGLRLRPARLEWSRPGCPGFLSQEMEDETTRRRAKALEFFTQKGEQPA